MSPNMKVSLVLFLMLCINFSNIAAQKNKGTIEGNVRNTTESQFSNVSVSLEGTHYGVFSDHNGYFKLSNIPEGEYTVVANFLGYKSDKKNVTVKANETITLEFELVEKSYTMPQIQVLGARDGIFDRVPGSVEFIDAKVIEYTAPVNGNEVFRRMLGVHVVEEEGAGLRTNIGIRGLDPDKSRSVLILEDGVPVALAPYGEPEMYYTPAMDRMAGVEVVKGSGSILFGPQTIGGVINYITADPPEESSGRASFRFGQGGYYTGMFGYGTTMGNTGIQVNYLRKSANQLANVMYRINDVSLKIKSKLSEKSTLGLKVGFYDEGSNSTYIGITQAMYDNGGDDFSFLAPDDLLEIRRYSLSTTFEHQFNSKLKLKTTGFGYTTKRDWRRQEFSYNPNSLTNPTGVVWGDTSVAGGAIYMDDRTGNRNRSFEVVGIEPRLAANYNMGKVENELETGMRFMYERAFEKRIDGTKKDASSGTLREDEIRTGYATSAFVQNRFKISNKFSVTAGVRTELFNYERDIIRGRFNIDGTNVLRDTSIVSNSQVFAVIPGVGFNYRVARTVGIFGGIHRGFAPPRVKDAISNSGEAMELDGEYSWNYELGVRSTLMEGLRFELTGFFMDFSNQIIPVSESAGGQGSGFVNGGRTRHGGIETGVSMDAGRLFGSKYVYQIDANLTYVHAVYNEDRFVGPDQINIKGNRTPYAPNVRFFASALFEAPFGLGLQLSGLYVGDQYTDPLNTVAPSADGRIGHLPSYFIMDGTVRYKIPKVNLTANLSMKNILNARYISTRRPQGIRVGMPRFVSAGLDFTF
jgi:Fe(3+) dicitrate transport protein